MALALALAFLVEAAPAAARELLVLPVPDAIDGTPIFVALAPDVIRAIDVPAAAS